MQGTLAYSIKPAGRHVLTIGRELIHDPYAAIIELVKNAYDADAPDVLISFKGEPEHDRYSIDVRDQGHGMSRDVVVNSWLVPSTPHKLLARKSPGGRTMQGRKGVGRYAASLLGDDLLLQTTTEAGEQTTVYVLWSEFENAPYLQDVEVLVETKQTSDPGGTLLHITGKQSMLEGWDLRQFRKLSFELKKLISPFAVSDQDEFKIYLKVQNFPGSADTEEIVKPYPIFELFDYRIAGTISADGKGVLTYCNQKSGDSEEHIPFQYGQTGTGCGEIQLDIRVYDREKDAIDELIKRGLRDDRGDYLGKSYARNVLNEYNGIGVYRHGFRIRPLGDAAFDWLTLNERRVQNPSMRIGSNQVIGYVQILSEEESGLIEKSARDGLKENQAFINLQEIAVDVIQKLEERRFEYRKSAGLGRKAKSAQHALNRLMSYDKLKKTVTDKLNNSGVDKKITEEIVSAIEAEQQDKTKIVEEIAEIVAIYQGQATLGKIINVILHEGRKPLNFFKNQIANLRHWNTVFIESQKPETAQRISSIAQGLEQNAAVFVKLFDRLDPLATAKRETKKPIPLKKTIRGAFDVFERELQDNAIELNIVGADEFKLIASSQDLYAIFTNLADNSIYWMNNANSTQKEINITIEVDATGLQFIDYKDTGPGIEAKHIESEAIFEPHFTTKPRGMGLGLAIAGEAASRNGLELKAFESGAGAYFRLQPKEEILR